MSASSNVGRKVDGASRDFARRLFVAHSTDLHQYASRRVGRDEANDVIAETFRRVVEHADRFDSRHGSERAWLFGITTNILRNYRRSEMRRIAALSREVLRVRISVDPLVDRGSQMDAEHDLRAVLDAAAALDAADYELLVLIVWEELSSVEVAAVLGIEPGTVRSRLHRIRRQLERSRVSELEQLTVCEGTD